MGYPIIFTGLSLNFRAFCPGSWKRALINCFLHRAHMICSTWKSFVREVDNLRNIFVENGYPTQVFDHTLNKFMSRKFTPDSKTDQANTILLVLPYLGLFSDRFKQKFVRFCKRFNINARIVFKPFKTAQYFSLKSRTPTLLQSGVIYKYVCPVDPGNVYIGRTRRHLCKRIGEHRNPLSQSAIFNHTMSCTCRFSTDNFSVLRSSRNQLELNILEALCIKDFSPNLNEQLAQSGQSILLRLF